MIMKWVAWVLVFKISSHEVRAKHKEAIGILPCAQFRKLSVFPASLEDFAVPRQKEDTFAYHPAYKRPTDKSPGGDVAWGLQFPESPAGPLAATLWKLQVWSCLLYSGASEEGWGPGCMRCRFTSFQHAWESTCVVCYASGVPGEKEPSTTQSWANEKTGDPLAGRLGMSRKSLSQVLPNTILL